MTWFADTGAPPELALLNACLNGHVSGAGGVQGAKGGRGVAAGLPEVSDRHDVGRAGLDVDRRAGGRSGKPAPRIGVEVHALNGDRAGPTAAAT